MADKPTKMTKRDIAYIVLISMCMATMATLSHNWPEYDEYDLQKAEHAYFRAETQYRSAYYDALIEARRQGYNDPEYKRLRQAKFDVRMPKGGSIESRMARRKKISDKLAAQADSVKNKVIQDYMDADSAYLATKQDLQQATEHLEFVRAEVRRADSLEQLPVHKLMWHNVKELFQKKR